MAVQLRLSLWGHQEPPGPRNQGLDRFHACSRWQIKLITRLSGILHFATDWPASARGVAVSSHKLHCTARNVCTLCPWVCSGKRILEWTSTQIMLHILLIICTKSNWLKIFLFLLRRSLNAVHPDFIIELTNSDAKWHKVIGAFRSDSIRTQLGQVELFAAVSWTNFFASPAWAFVPAWHPYNSFGRVRFFAR